MEAIRNYLETMFLNLPNTPEVYKAKDELWQMMEDKYTELKAEGKTENEAVGIVISEFGNLDDLAKDLGIDRYMQESPLPAGKTFPLEDAKRYLSDYSRHAFLIALGVMLCILSICGPIFCEAIAIASGYDRVRYMEAIGASVMFFMVAVAVGLFIYSSVTIGRWNYMKRERYVTDFATTEYLHHRLESYKPTYALLLTVGVILCVICFVPAIFLDAFSGYSPFWNQSSGAFTFILVAIGVFLIVMGGIRMKSYNTLIQLNQQNTVGGNYTTSQQNSKQYTNSTVAAIMSVYWPTVTCLYLIWSFLTFDWYISWVIWPIAAIINSLVENLMEK